MESEKKWYVIHTYSGYENKVKANLERKVHSMGMESEIFKIVVPLENEIENKIIFTAEKQPDETGEDQLPSFSFKRAATQGLTNLEISVLS